MLFEALKEATKIREDAAKAAAAAANAALRPALQQFMEQHPDVRAIAWSQYTPYFNDGEPCVFSVNEIHVLPASYVVAEGDDDPLTDAPYGDGWEELPWRADGELPGVSRDTLAALRDLNRTLQNAEPELEAVFGDHAIVVVTKDGAQVETYDHD